MVVNSGGIRTGNGSRKRQQEIRAGDKRIVNHAGSASRHSDSIYSIILSQNSVSLPESL